MPKDHFTPFSSKSDHIFKATYSLPFDEPRYSTCTLHWEKRCPLRGHKKWHPLYHHWQKSARSPWISGTSRDIVEAWVPSQVLKNKAWPQANWWGHSSNACMGTGLQSWVRTGVMYLLDEFWFWDQFGFGCLHLILLQRVQRNIIIWWRK